MTSYMKQDVSGMAEVGTFVNKKLGIQSENRNYIKNCYHKEHLLLKMLFSFKNKYQYTYLNTYIAL